MGLFDWLKRRGVPRQDSRLRGWRHAWAQAAAATCDQDGHIARLAAELDGFGLPSEDVEIEQEMLEALRDREQLRASVRTSGLPMVETGHRVVRGEPCHYSAPASMPDEIGQPSGRLLLTGSRAIFVGGAKGVSAAWHTISEAAHHERDVLLVRNGPDQACRFRCNSYGDALRAAFIAGELLTAHRRPRPTDGKDRGADTATVYNPVPPP
jgi:hypothetical protein